MLDHPRDCTYNTTEQSEVVGSGNALCGDFWVGSRSRWEHPSIGSPRQNVPQYREVKSL